MLKIVLLGLTDATNRLICITYATHRLIWLKDVTNRLIGLTDDKHRLIGLTDATYRFISQNAQFQYFLSFFCILKLYVFKKTSTITHTFNYSINGRF